MENLSKYLLQIPIFVLVSSRQKKEVTILDKKMSLHKTSPIESEEKNHPISKLAFLFHKPLQLMG